MPTQYKERNSETKLSGFTIVFRLGEKKTAVRVAMSSSKTKQRSKSFVRSLIESAQAESVLGDRVPLRHDPILSRLYVVGAGDFGHTQEYLERIESEADVEFAYVAPPRDVLVQRSTQASKSRTHNDSWRAQIKLAEAQELPQWTVTKRVSVAVVDSGIDIQHPQLSHIEFIDHLGKPPGKPDVMGHGTHVIGLIAAAACTGNAFKGVATDCVDITAHRGLVRPEDVAGYYRALRAAGSARIINLSVGGEFEDRIEADIIRDSLDGGSIVIAAMGNSRELGNPLIYPAAQDEVISVGAVDSAGTVADFSNFGDHIVLAAPGVDIQSTVPTYDVPDLAASGNPPLGTMSGTSMATPIVTAVIARMLAYRPQLTRSQVIDLIKTCLTTGWNPDIGHGILDAHALLSAL
jgi:hypothetical protein